MVDRGGLENRCGPMDHRGFESHPLRHGIVDFRHLHLRAVQVLLIVDLKSRSGGRTLLLCGE